jgi:hypothetical protein
VSKHRAKRIEHSAKGTEIKRLWRVMKGYGNREDKCFRKSPLTPLCQRGVTPPFSKGRGERLDSGRVNIEPEAKD